MFGSGLPVLARDYCCISGSARDVHTHAHTRPDAAAELVHDGLDGHLFDSEGRLGQLLVTMFGSGGSSMLATTKQHVLRLQQLRWNENWNLVVLPVLKRV